MDDSEVIARAADEGFELEWRPVNGKWCVGFVRFLDLRYRVFGEERLAISYMAGWLRRGRIFREAMSGTPIARWSPAGSGAIVELASACAAGAPSEHQHQHRGPEEDDDGYGKCVGAHPGPLLEGSGHATQRGTSRATE